MNQKLILAGFAVAAAMTSFTFAQEPSNTVPSPPTMPSRGARPFMQGPGMQNTPLFYRMLERPEFISKLGLPEEKVKILQEGFKKIADEESELIKHRSELLKKNSELITEFMADRTKTPEVLEQSFAEIEALQVKMSKLSVDRMVIIRDNLDEEQIKNARESVKTQFEERRKERMQRFGEQNGNGPRRFGGPGAGAPMQFPGQAGKTQAPVPVPAAAPAPAPAATSAPAAPAAAAPAPAEQK